MDCILVRYGEIATKARPTRRHWEEVLSRNIEACLPSCKVKRIEGRLLVSGLEDFWGLRHIFGITSFSPAKRIEADMVSMCGMALSELRRMKGERGTEKPLFRVSARRLLKDFAKKSQEVNAIVGSYILERELSEVSLANFEIDIGIEIERDAYLFTEKYPGPGGIPVGVQGSVFCDLRREDDALASLLMLKRGCTLIVSGKEELRRLLEPFSPGHPILRGTQVATLGIVTGDMFETLDFESMKKRTLPIYTPLIGLTEEEIGKLREMVFGGKD